MKTRREFLTIAAGATAASILHSKAWATPMGLPIGIQLYAVRDTLPKDPAGTLKQLHTIGYREVETAGFAGKTSKEFRALLDDAGLKCPSAHLQLTEGDPSSAFADANALGAQYATSSVLVPFDRVHKGAGPLALDDFKHMAARMNEVGKLAKAAGLTYAYHNHNIEFSKLPDGRYGYDLLLTETDPTLVKFEADCGWLTVAGVDPVAYFKKYPGRYRMLHVKDFQTLKQPTISLTPPDRPNGTELGHGFIQYKRIFAAGKAAGIQHAFAEQEAPFAHSQLDSAKVDYDFLNSFS